MIDIEKHPCFSIDAKGKYARVHLPVAPKCNIQCNYCKRDYDCVNESRPGVTSKVLSPEQALTYLVKLKEKMPHLSVVGIAGPGDPFANPVETMTTLRLIRKEFPEMILCLSSNGLNVAPYVDELAELKVSHVTITINAFDPEVTKDVYKWVRLEKRGFVGAEGAKVLLEKQLEAIKLLKMYDITVKINTIVIPGINDHLVGDIAKTAKELGADLMNTIPLYPVEGTPFENLTEPSAAMMKVIRADIAKHIKPMTHCARCRADAVGLLGKDDPEAAKLLNDIANMTVTADETRPYVAVASHEGLLVNQHLGEADTLYIYKETSQGYRMVEQRRTPPSGTGNHRWQALGESLSDCRALLVGGIGPSPSAIIGRTGIKIVEMTGLIDDGLDAMFKGKSLKTIKKADVFRCGAECSGKGTGCG
ncbi:nitrogenase cofactor biosynthesis protein NifB [Mangrovibacterium diazotrophicum]|uniref:FeMo cofactor biosynthesis protein NifB n=1 Tax=Mangrovibacterium diazotrophicum TaxID=1261403 RepID=A0A419WBY8_9BACT|nr:nitrogenase cofactor biosynthesis protein NifB [Mangrovibacterium diazotrophicum]RKD92906.1 nitrogen fixation protein NifB [Mangrovibacterium diazotrophicum]